MRVNVRPKTHGASGCSAARNMRALQTMYSGPRLNVLTASAIL